MTEKRKWILVFLGGALSMLLFEVLLIGGFIAYINYEGKMTEDQKKSLGMIENLKTAPQPDAYTSELPDVEPEIYDDRQDNNDEGGDGSLSVIRSLQDASQSPATDENLPDVEPEIYDDSGSDEGEGE